MLDTGPESGIYKSTDNGESWEQLGNGLPGGDQGKIALGVSVQKPNVVYATVELPDRKGGIWRSEDRGASWSNVSDFVSGGTGPHYYQELYVDPHHFDVLYHANNILVRSEDGGRTWIPIEGRAKHVDNHAVVFHPTDPEYLLVGTDGGLYESHDYARSFRFFPNLPITQFYKIDVDYDVPFYNVVGGTQDNNSQYGPTRTRFVQGIRNSDWSITVGGDGHDNAIDPTNPNIIYGESQQGFIRRFDRLTGQSVDIQPQPGKGEEGLRFNWDSPILISPHQPS
ncbi:MAG: WD40/YVTN/BNR-like repeat-containing protein, partial [Planctomycetota bacterium]